MASLALQKALRERLTTFAAVTALVSPSNVIDSHVAPTQFPAIVIGQDYEVAADVSFEHAHVDVVMTLHVWDRAPGLTGAKAISDAIHNAIKEPLNVDGTLVPVWFGSARFLRDKDGVTAHGVITLETLMGA